MIKNTICILGLLLSFSSFSAEKYVMVVFHGMGGYPANNIDESTEIPAELSNFPLEKFYNAGNAAGGKKFNQILENFHCGSEANSDLGLIIMGYSWGARGVYEFSKAFEEKCGRKADRAYLIDGIQKIATQFKKAPIGTVCKNYFKTVSPIRGRSLDNCENHDLTDLCKMEGGMYQDGMQCHQTVLQAGYKLVMEDLQTL